ncbi:MAG TPA: polysaccharide biosynthesis/export family protein [Candidatus Acidoferrales bacterium]|nr:polysaccharide biosynthesis/export family protein [Candidatus Acidoferrales bacterium]
MDLTVRKALDCAEAKPVWLALLLLSWLILPGSRPACGQDKVRTPQQTNARIQELAKDSHPQLAENPVGAGDVLHIDVFDVPDLSRDVRVSDSGMISLPLLPDHVAVSGCSTFQLEQELERLLQENGLVMHPQVSVMVKEQNSEPISVVGAVGHPMVYHEFRPTNLLEVLAEAGGITDDAGDTVIITRESPQQATCGKSDPSDPADPPSDPQTITVHLSDLLQTGDPAFNVPVLGGDVITVPRAGIVYIAGAVAQPGGYPLHDPGEVINTMKAIALAHGLGSTAKANDAVILRKDSATGQTKEINVKLKKIMNRKAPDVPLYANDILFVPDSTTKRILGHAAAAALSITTGLAILKGSQ